MKMKKKLFIPLIAALLTIGLTSVGFAAWVLVGETSLSPENGAQFTAHTVTDARIKFTAEFSDAAVNLAAPESHNNYTWLKFDGDAKEDLNATLKITITNWAEVKTTNATFTFALTAKKGDATVNLSDYTAYVVAPTLTGSVAINKGVLQDNSLNASLDAANGVLTIPLTFTWGSTFDTDNPFTYYNVTKKNATEDEKTAAEAALNKLLELNGVTFNVAVTGKTQ